MTDRIRVTVGVARLLVVLVDRPSEWRYGLDLMRVTGQPSGVLYPMLTRLLAAEWLEAQWEDIDPVAEARPARRYYRLTPDGLALARTELADLSARLSPGRRGRLGPADAAGAANSAAGLPAWAGVREWLA
jgi:PadR family transcriptional regulator, regulatory protein PadR